MSYIEDINRLQSVTFDDMVRMPQRKTCRQIKEYLHGSVCLMALNYWKRKMI